MLRCVFFGSSVFWWAMFHFVACGIVRDYVYSWGQINPQKRHTKLTAFVARVSIAQWCQPFLSMCVRSTPFIGDVEERFWAIIAENLRHCIQRCYCWSSRGTLHHRQKQQGPTTSATCYKVSLSQARRSHGPKCTPRPHGMAFIQGGF